MGQVIENHISMYYEILTDQENTIILLCQHLRKCITLLEAYTDIDKEEQFLASIEEKQGIITESEDKQ